MARLHNSLMVELIVPREVRTPTRLTGFFSTIGWQQVRPDSEEDGFWYVGPFADSTPIIGYWATDDPEKTIYFQENHAARPSIFAGGPYLANGAMVLAEVALVVPDDETVARLWERGGELLEAHATQPLHTFYGAQEFRFTDPFGFHLRLTADPGYQLPTD